MCTFEELWEDILPDWNQEHDHEGEENPSYWDPCDPKANKKICGLEECEHGNRLEWHSLDKCCMVLFQHPAKIGKW